MRFLIQQAMIAFAFACTLGTISGQIFQPVHWNTELKPVKGNTYQCVFKAKIDKGWCIYSQYLESDDGPVRTSLKFEKGSHYVLVGKATESGGIKKIKDPIFDMMLTKFYDEAIFTQEVTISDPSKPIRCAVEFMSCDHERCLPPETVDFTFSAQKSESSTVKDLLTTGATQGANNGGGAGILDPVHWSGLVSKMDGNQYQLQWLARMDKDWTIYSQYLESQDGPIATAIKINGGGATTQGKIKETGNKFAGFDPYFEMQVVKYSDSAQFTQILQIQDPSKPITGTITFMACDKKQCIPEKTLYYQAIPATGMMQITDQDPSTSAISQTDIKTTSALYPIGSGVKLDQPKSRCANIPYEEGGHERKSIWTIFFLGFVGGLLALLTPCVFPMIPLTVSFFTKGSKNKKEGLRKAALYGFFIFLVYLILSVPFHLLDSINPDILNDISTNIWLNIAFFVIFLVFAFSFFGYYELTLPESWTNKASSAEGVGGILGIFFMALTLALVSFSCTGPILGSLLAGAISGSGGAWQLTSGMSGFGLALALPFAFFAAFPGYLHSLPKSGGWLNIVKVILGFLELALAFKFLSNADLVKHWGLLKIEPFLIIWILCALGIAFYLFGWIRFPHDSPIKKLGMGRILGGAVALSAAIYLCTGFIFDKDKGTFRPLKLLSGLAPPAGYSWIHPRHCPNNLDCFTDLTEGVNYARKNNKPIMIDFTGYACVNCRKMEEHVWPEKEVYRYLKDEYVLISLYVDEKVQLPEAERVTVQKKTGGTRTLKNAGEKWSHFQTEYFNNNSQPYYVLLSPQGELLTSPVGYTPDVSAYARWLECGLQAWKASK